MVGVSMVVIDLPGKCFAITIVPEFGDDRYDFQSLLTIQDDWIYIKAKKWGINEAGYESFLPGYYVAIHVNGIDWKEVSEADLPVVE